MAAQSTTRFLPLSSAERDEKDVRGHRRLFPWFRSRGSGIVRSIYMQMHASEQISAKIMIKQSQEKPRKEHKMQRKTAEGGDHGKPAAARPDFPHRQESAKKLLQMLRGGGFMTKECI